MPLTPDQCLSRLPTRVLYSVRQFPSFLWKLCCTWTVAVCSTVESQAVPLPGAIPFPASPIGPSPLDGPLPFREVSVGRGDAQILYLFIFSCISSRGTWETRPRRPAHTPQGRSSRPSGEVPMPLASGSGADAQLAGKDVSGPAPPVGWHVTALLTEPSCAPAQ